MKTHRKILVVTTVVALSGLALLSSMFLSIGEAAPELPPTPAPVSCKCTQTPLGIEQHIYNCLCGNLQCVVTDSGRLACVR
jgi:hypothetical protein